MSDTSRPARLSRRGVGGTSERILWRKRNMNIEKLIEAVKNRLVLYDISHPKYMDTKYKNRVWENIGQELGIDGTACKTRWTNLRDTYRKSLKRAAMKSGQSAKRIKYYKYDLQMEFLRPFLINEQQTDDVYSDLSNEPERSETDRQSEINMTSIESNQSSPLSYHSEPTSLLVSQKLKRPRQKCAPRSYSRPASSSLTMEHLISNNETSATVFNHPVDAFLLGAISPILKSLPPYELALAKSELFTLAQKYEFKMVKLNDNEH